MDKRVAIVVLGSQGQEIKDLTIAPGSTVNDALREARLEGYVISRADGGLLAPQDNLYTSVQDGEKLYASTPAEVGKACDGSE